MFQPVTTTLLCFCMDTVAAPPPPLLNTTPSLFSRLFGDALHPLLHAAILISRPWVNFSAVFVGLRIYSVFYYYEDFLGPLFSRCIPQGSTKHPGRHSTQPQLFVMVSSRVSLQEDRRRKASQ